MENGREDDDRNVILLVGPEGSAKKFVLSRTVVRLTSEVFEDLLSRDTGPSNTYKIPDIDPGLFQHVVRYMFMHSDWRFNGKLEDACSLIQLAEKYKLDELLRIICKQISDLNFDRDRLIQNSNACFIFNVLRNTQCGEERLWEPVLSYICQNASAILKQNSFLELSTDSLVDILREDSLAVQSELEVFKLTMKWGMANLRKQSKQCTIENLRTILEWPLRLIRFPNMNEFDFQNYVQPTEILNPQQERNLLDWWDMRKINDTIEIPEVMFSTKSRNYCVEDSWDTCQEDDCSSSVDSIRAELFQAKYTAECENSNLKLAVSLLRHQLDEKSAELESFKAKFRRELQTSLVDFLKLLKEEVGAVKAEMSSQILSTGGQIQSESEKLKGDMTKLREEFSGKMAEHTTKLGLCVIDVWKIFLNESHEAGSQLSNFQDTEKFACAVLLKNQTSTLLLEPLSHFFYLSPSQCYKPMPQEIQRDEIATFGFTENSYGTCGLFSYRIGERRFLVSFYVYSNNRNEFAIGFIPAGTTLDDQLYKGMRFADWAEKTDRRKVNCQAPILEGTVEFGSYRARASMKSAKKAFLTILISNAHQ